MVSILLHNIGYGLGHTGSIKNYIQRAYRFLWCPRQTLLNNLDDLQHQRKELNPDLTLYVETDVRHFDYLCEPNQGIALDKYKEGGNSKYGNGIITTNEYKAMFIPHGKKRLLYEIELDKNTFLLFFHFSLSARTRKKQLQYISEYIRQGQKEENRFILAGDFNIFKGLDELSQILTETKMVCGGSAPTYPSVKPKLPLDLFLIDGGIEIVRCEVLNESVSDHLPVLLEVKL
jgi:endonuclease/exonuclease/phosphatase family metal-dependent hydrolase